MFHLKVIKILECKDKSFFTVMREIQRNYLGGDRQISIRVSHAAE